LFIAILLLGAEENLASPSFLHPLYLSTGARVIYLQIEWGFILELRFDGKGEVRNADSLSSREWSVVDCRKR
jgi:hypothetical protein